MIVEIKERQFVNEEDGKTVVLKELLDLEGKVTKSAHIGVGPFSVNGRVVPINFLIEAVTVEEAMDKYEEAHKEACKKQVEEMSKPRLLVPEGSAPKQVKGKILTGDFGK